MSDPMTEHHRANILPPRHDRDDYDFDYKDGVPGPIRIGAIVVPDVPINIPAKVWCKRHGWEIEPAPSTEEPDRKLTAVERWQTEAGFDPTGMTDHGAGEIS